MSVDVPFTPLYRRTIFRLTYIAELHLAQLAQGGDDRSGDLIGDIELGQRHMLTAEQTLGRRHLEQTSLAIGREVVVQESEGNGDGDNDELLCERRSPSRGDASEARTTSCLVALNYVSQGRHSITLHSIRHTHTEMRTAILSSELAIDMPTISRRDNMQDSFSFQMYVRLPPEAQIVF